MDPLVVLAIGTVLLLAVLIGRRMAHRPRHRRSGAEWRSAHGRLARRQETYRSGATPVDMPP
ncbi:hypothetical protein GCM10011504_57070 [Siccirubricoccus deserti]|nr:hypothetical protein GCM10011504_57070 [Siccirubricoccus deserti]